MNFSVVISTVNRADSLQHTLEALRWQRHESFEVILVNGPSTDDTDLVLSSFAPDIRVARCDDLNLSKSRNIGISMASGEIVAFIDDDAIPEPDWLSGLEQAYSDDKIAGAGGVVFDHTGCALQYKYSSSDRVGRTRFEIEPPLGRFNVPGAEQFLYLQGTNMSFRRAQLAEIGGFDEEIEYNFDEVEVCLNLIDRGYKLCPLLDAAVHHKYLASHVRNTKRLFTDPFFAIKNRVYFALRFGQVNYSTTQVLSVLMDYVNEVKAAARHQHSEGLFTSAQLSSFLRRVDLGVDVGVERGMNGRRQSVTISRSKPDEFLSFPTHQPSPKPLCICFISQEYPPDDFGGIGRFTADLASGLASRGHEVHVVTRSTNGASVDFENGVWLHRIVSKDHGLGDLTDSPIIGNLDHIASVYKEVSNLHVRRPLDLVSAPLWAAEGLMCSLDPDLVTVTTLMTTMRKVADLHESWSDLPQIAAALRLEKVTIESTHHIHAISQAILREIDTNFDIGGTDTHVIPLGARDIPSNSILQRPASQQVTVLFVGRLEFRKGVDVLLEAITRLTDAFPEVHFTLVGKDTINTELGESYRVAFGRLVEDKPELAETVEFTGPISDKDLDRLYATADIFCAPSRYESFGLVLLEAMRYGLPVIGCDVGGMPEIIKDGDSGLLATPGDVDSLVHCLQTLIEDSDRRAMLGQNARKRYEEFFSLDTAVSNTEAAYAKIAGECRTRNDLLDTEDSHLTITERLGDALELAADMNPVTARLAAIRLLDRGGAELSPLEQLEGAWKLSSDDFVQAAYYAVLSQAPDPQGITLARGALEDGMSRVLFIRGLARSHLARDLGISTAWLPELMELAGDDYPNRLYSSWQLPDEEFVACAYEILLRREVEQSGLLMWLDRLETGLSRVEFIRELTKSTEGKTKILDSTWLEKFEAEAPEWEVWRRESTASRTTLRSHIGKTPILGNLVRKLIGMSEGLLALRKLPAAISQLEDEFRGRQQGLTESITRIEHQIEHQVSANRNVSSAMDTRLDHLEGEFAGIFEETLSVAHKSEAAILSFREAIATASATDAQGMDRLDTRITEQGFLVEKMGQRIDILHAKSEALSLDLREQIVAPREERHVESHVMDESIYNLRLDEMHGDIHVNVGCGEKPLSGYLNVDFRELPHVDLVADARDLPFEPETLAEIMSSHLVEHFRQHQLVTVILPHWRNLLRPKGRLRIICPNWSVMLDRVNSGEMSEKDFKTLTFGLQDYAGDDHFAMYTPESLTDILKKVGFDHIELIVADRQNGLCPEMELLATKDGQMLQPMTGSSLATTSNHEP